MGGLTPPGSGDPYGPEDEFFSPIVVPDRPSFERDRRAVLRLLASGQVICRNRIARSYIESVLDDDDVAIWLVRDARRRIFGFALTVEREDLVVLELICSHPRKGEGASLFRNVLAYSQQQQKPLVLQAVNAKVALLYGTIATDVGRPVHLATEDDAPGPRLTPDDLQTNVLEGRVGAVDMIFPVLLT